MKYYSLAEIDITDPSWVREYVERVTAMVERRGGRYLARTGQAERVEGERVAAGTYLIIEWPSKQAANEFYSSEEYRPYREQRRRGARNEFVLVAGEDATGAARMSDQ